MNLLPVGHWRRRPESCLTQNSRLTYLGSVMFVTCTPVVFNSHWILKVCLQTRKRFGKTQVRTFRLRSTVLHKGMSHFIFVPSQVKLKFLFKMADRQVKMSSMIEMTCQVCTQRCGHDCSVDRNLYFNRITRSVFVQDKNCSNAPQRHDSVNWKEIIVIINYNQKWL